jgi:hypothetical protein
MKPILILAIAAFPAIAADVSAVKNVYLLPMSRGLDQFLAQRLTAQGIVQVVTDPQKADAIFTDRVGANFEESLTELYQAAKAAAPEKIDEVVYARPAMQPLSRGKGNIFLVDRNSHEVIWSAFVVAATSEAREMNKVASKVADQFAKARKPAK